MMIASVVNSQLCGRGQRRSGVAEGVVTGLGLACCVCVLALRVANAGQYAADQGSAVVALRRFVCDKMVRPFPEDFSDCLILF
jgi:hypothetical protein